MAYSWQNPQSYHAIRNHLNKDPAALQVFTPSCSKWFSMEEIHEIEKDQMCEFFLGKPSKTPTIYKKYRNFIISLYRQNPRKYLTATTCRRSLAGDVCSVIRIHQFLEHWGLINFTVDPKTQKKDIFRARSQVNGAKFLKVSQEGIVGCFLTC